jgi:hypothetical protein
MRQVTHVIVRRPANTREPGSCRSGRTPMTSSTAEQKGHTMKTGYDVCVDRSDGTSEPLLIEADNSGHALSQALLDPTVRSAVVV